MLSLVWYGVQTSFKLVKGAQVDGTAQGSQLGTVNPNLFELAWWCWVVGVSPQPVSPLSPSHAQTWPTDVNFFWETLCELCLSLILLDHTEMFSAAVYNESLDFNTEESIISVISSFISFVLMCVEAQSCCNRKPATCGSSDTHNLVLSFLLFYSLSLLSPLHVDL